MSSTVMLPNRLPLIAALILLVNSIGGVLSAAYTRADDINLSVSKTCASLSACHRLSLKR